LAIKDEKGGDSMLVPEIEMLPDIILYARQAPERRKQWLIRGLVIQKEAQKIGSIDSNGAVFKVGDVVGAITWPLAQTFRLQAG
jgi:hypothetical protein